jgi:predicted dehydrogenase
MTVEMDTHVLGLIEFAAGVIGSMTTSFDVWDSQTPRLEIYGEYGTICIPDPDPVHGANIFQGEVWYRTTNVFLSRRDGPVGNAPHTIGRLTALGMVRSNRLRDDGTEGAPDRNGIE